MISEEELEECERGLSYISGDSPIKGMLLMLTTEVRRLQEENKVYIRALPSILREPEKPISEGELKAWKEVAKGNLEKTHFLCCAYALSLLAENRKLRDENQYVNKK